MNKLDSEKDYLCIEANYLLDFLNEVREKKDNNIIILNQSYGLVSVAPIRDILSQNFEIQTTKVGSSESHNNPLILKTEIYYGFENRFFEDQPNLVIVDGTRNVGGTIDSLNKYPDSQQGFLNYAITLNDAISDSNYSKYANLLNVSYKHVLRLRNTKEYNQLINNLDVYLNNADNLSLYEFNYWNPANLELSLYNSYRNSQKKVNNINLEKLINPSFIFINSTMPHSQISILDTIKREEHTPAYFDDNDAYSAPYPKFSKSGFEIESKFDLEMQNWYKKMFKK